MPASPEDLAAFQALLADYRAKKAALEVARGALQSTVEKIGAGLSEGEARAIGGPVNVVRKVNGRPVYETLKGLGDS